MVTPIIFIPIRKGSKGVPNKNVRDLCGKPLVCWIIDTLLSLRNDISIWVSTDSEEAEVLLVSRYGNQVNVFRRNPNNAQDNSPVIEAVNEFIYSRGLHAQCPFILVQATSPFTTIQDFQCLLKSIASHEAESYISCCRVKRFCWSDDGHPLNYTLTNKPMRQQYNGILLENGAFYASCVGLIQKSGMLISGKIKIIETSPGTMIDIDEEKDWIAAEHYIIDNELA